ncbi:MAG: helix-turn-helix domain-containing protein [Prochloraceae cyanobacterium]|nr:helix-turn-helix domain-containing protein [Prochloraceae cyanobacterium]
MTLTLNYCYRIYPHASQEEKMLGWLETCRRLYNRCLQEVKDWYNSKKCLIDRCSIKLEYIIPVNQPFPGYYNQQNALPKLKNACEEEATGTSNNTSLVGTRSSRKAKSRDLEAPTQRSAQVGEDVTGRRCQYV